jgi:hypothetical protein
MALLILCAVLMLWRPAPGVPAWAPWLGFALQAALLLGGPLMARLETSRGSLDADRYRLMITTH